MKTITSRLSGEDDMHVKSKQREPSTATWTSECLLAFRWKTTSRIFNRSRLFHAAYCDRLTVDIDGSKIAIVKIRRKRECNRMTINFYFDWVFVDWRVLLLFTSRACTLLRHGPQTPHQDRARRGRNWNRAPCVNYEALIWHNRTMESEWKRKKEPMPSHCRVWP